MNVLFICTANVCRSPLAEGYLKYILNSKPIPGVEVSSAGVLALAGSRAFDCSVEVARLTGFDLGQHKARQLTIEIAHSTDLILCMETWQASKVVDLDDALLEKTALLGNYHPGGHRFLQIPDPRNFNVPHTMEVFQMIRESVEALHKKLLNS